MRGTLQQGILVISCADAQSPVDLIRDIMEIEGAPEKDVIKFDRHEISCYPWHITTKYYEADVHFVQLMERDLVSQEFSGAIEAVVIYFDNHDPDSFEKVNTWMPFIDEFEPEIKMLVCKTAHEDSREYPSRGRLRLMYGYAAISRRTTQNWCITKGFELIEKEPADETDDEDVEDDFHESKSVRRIMQALHAHPWPFLDLKTAPNYKPSSKFQELLASEDLNERERVTSELRPDMENRIDSLLEENKQVFEEIEKSQSEGSFENLFDRFKDMKEKAANLSGDERRLYAEKTALQFWKALGGDDEDDDPQDPHQDSV